MPSPRFSGHICVVAVVFGISGRCALVQNRLQPFGALLYVRTMIARAPNDIE